MKEELNTHTHQSEKIFPSSALTHILRNDSLNFIIFQRKSTFPVIMGQNSIPSKIPRFLRNCCSSQCIIVSVTDQAPVKFCIIVSYSLLVNISREPLQFERWSPNFGILRILVSWCSVSINVFLYYERPATQRTTPGVRTVCTIDVINVHVFLFRSRFFPFLTFFLNFHVFY